MIPDERYDWKRCFAILDAAAKMKMVDDRVPGAPQPEEPSPQMTPWYDAADIEQHDELKDIIP